MNARIAIFGLMAAVMMALPGSARHRGSDVQEYEFYPEDNLALVRLETEARD